jgi:hypothetical protein
MSPPAKAQAWWPVVGLALAVPLASLLIARFGFGFDGLSGQDGHEYARYAGAIKIWLNGGEHPGWHYWSVGYSFSGALLASIIGDPIISLQLISALSLGAIMLACNGMLERLYGGNDAAVKMGYLFCIVLMMPELALAGVRIMSDILAMAFSCAALLVWLNFRHKPTGRGLILFSLAVGAAIWTRYVCVVLLFLPACDVLRIALSRLPWTTFIPPVLVIIPFVVSHFLLKQAHAADMFEQIIDRGWSPQHWFARTFSTADGISQNRWPNLVYVASFPLRRMWWPMLPLLAFARPRDFASTEARLLLAAIIAYMLFVAGVPLQNGRFLLPVAPLFVVLLFPAARRLLAMLKARWQKAVMVAIAVGIALAMQVRLVAPHARQNKVERQIAARLSEYPATTPLYIFAYDPALRNRMVRQPMHNLWLQRYSEFPEGALVLFAPQTLAPQWQGRNPMRNWDQLEATHQLTIEARFPDGWNLYRIGNAL